MINAIHNRKLDMILGSRSEPKRVSGKLNYEKQTLTTGNQKLKQYEDNSCFQWEDKKELSSVKCHGHSTGNCHKLKTERARYLEVSGTTQKVSKEKKKSMKGLSFCLPYNFANFLSYQYCKLELLKQKQNEEYPTQFAEISKERNDATFLFTSLNSFYNKIIVLSVNIICSSPGRIDYFIDSLGQSD